MALYRGFSTVNRVKKYKVTDFDLVKQDLLNHFSIRKGEKLMNPDFGTIIWNVLFEPLTDDIRQIVINDVKTIAAYDPRLSVENVVVSQKDFGLQIELDIRMVTSNQLSNMVLKFDGNTQQLSELAQQ